MTGQFPVRPRAVRLTHSRIPLIMRRCGRDESYWEELINEAISDNTSYYVVINYPDSAFYTTFVIATGEFLREHYEFDERAIETWFTKLYAK